MGGDYSMRDNYSSYGFVCISTKPAEEHRVYSKLLRIDGVIEIHPLFGEYDLIVKIGAQDDSKLKKIVDEQIKEIDAVQRTLFLNISNSESMEKKL